MRAGEQIEPMEVTMTRSTSIALRDGVHERPILRIAAVNHVRFAEDTAVVIATRGRPAIVRALVESLAKQTMPPGHIFVVASSAADTFGLEPDLERVSVHIGRTGSAHQRNDGIALAGSRYPYVLFFDDDFVPSRFWIERARAILRDNPAIIGLTGLVLADGTSTSGITLDEAQAMVANRDAYSLIGQDFEEAIAYGGNMGCNMAYRLSVLQALKFDERLPLYAWLEDADFRARAERFGRIVRANELWGVHLGHKAGRVSGVRFGYSQIANAVYLARKGTVPRSHLAKTTVGNLLSNVSRSFRPELFVDRRGRLRGNVLALLDLLRGRLAPERVLEI